ncbi:MAG TPA: FAD-binding oxidoreductase [Gemmatimonadales bacterium]|nr:FAD-binding oxidoreductase [Gemmatimonadales bacterium]
MDGPVVVIGGGVIGASVAWHLAVQGWSNIVIVDRAAGPGEGSTGRATGGYRAQYATEINVRLSLLAREKLRRFREEVGADPGYDPAGYLWIASTEWELAELRRGLPVQHGAGLAESREVDAVEILQINPALAPDDIAGGTWCPSDGFIRPLSILAGYLADARRRGVRTMWETEVTGFERRGAFGSSRVTAVRTSRGTIAAEVVVNAAGAWAARIAALAGVALQIEPLRRCIVPTEPCDLLPPHMPMTIFAGDGFHLRVRDGRVLLAWPTPGSEVDAYDCGVESGWIDDVAAKAAARIPALRNVALDRAGAWGGLYEVSPDKHAILGPSPECGNFYLANGSSGHGVMHSPALGQLLAEIISDGRATTLDATPLRPSRFAEGEPNPVSGLL